MDSLLIGETIRYLRRQQGKNLEDLADDNISVSTISNIERGIPSTPCRLEYLLSKLGTTYEELKMIAEKRKCEEERLLMSLKALESEIRHNGSCTAVRKIKLEPKHPLQPYLNYLLGKHYLHGNPQTAIYYFEKSIELADKLPNYDVRQNIPAIAYLDLGLLAFQNNNLQLALHHTEQGINSFVKGGERKDTINSLLYNQALFHYHLGNIDKAARILDALCSKINSISRAHVKAHIYELKALIFLDQKEYEKAKEICKEAIEFSYECEVPDVSFNIWTTIGQIGLEMTNCNCDEEKSFLTALCFEKSLKRKNKVATAYLGLGKLYTKNKRLQEARECIEKGITIAEKHNDMIILVDGLLALADYWEHMKDIDSAKKEYEKACWIANRYNFRKKIEKIKESLSELERRGEHVYTRS